MNERNCIEYKQGNHGKNHAYSKIERVEVLTVEKIFHIREVVGSYPIVFEY